MFYDFKENTNVIKKKLEAIQSVVTNLGKRRFEHFDEGYIVIIK